MAVALRRHIQPSQAARERERERRKKEREREREREREKQKRSERDREKKGKNERGRQKGRERERERAPGHQDSMAVGRVRLLLPAPRRRRHIRRAAVGATLHRGTALIRNTPLLGPYGRTMRRALGLGSSGSCPRRDGGGTSGALPSALPCTEGFVFKLMPSDRKLKASSEGSK